MPSKKNKKKRRLGDIAPIYTEDLGSEGIKNARYSLGSDAQDSNFHVPLTEDEEHRRRKRMVSLIRRIHWTTLLATAYTNLTRYWRTGTVRNQPKSEGGT